MTINYSTLYNLSELGIIVGTDKLLTFTVYEQDGTTLQDITGTSPNWYLCPFGVPEYIVLEKTGTVATANTFTISVSAGDEVGLSGKYTQQVSITDFEGKTFKIGQGVVVILPGTLE